jgi:cell division transport system permease protein
VLLKSVQTLGTQIAGTPQISIFLATGTSAGDVENIGNKLRQHPGIKRIEFISREVALKKLQQSTGMSDVIGGLSQNPLPDAFVIYPKGSGVASLEALRDELKTWPRFEHVQLDSAWVHKLEALLDFGRMAVAILAALLSFALIAITFNTIRLQILTRREEIEVAKLIGATDAFIRRPFLYFGLTQGLLGGITAWLLVACSLLLLNHQVGTLTQLYASNFSLQHLSFGDSLTLLGFSAYLGWLGAWFSVSQHLWQIEPR